MRIMKSFTDFSQSKKLAEILPPESADMRIGNYVGKSGKVDGTNIHYYPKGESFGAPEIIYAWSLAALLCVLSQTVRLVGTSKDSYWYCECVNANIQWYASVGNADNPVDVCYEMIVELNKHNLI